MKIHSKYCLIVVLLIEFACTKEKKYQYEVNPVTVSQENSEKSNRKSTTEFISIAYADLFGTNIPQSKLINLSIAYSSFGDLGVIEERIISNFLNDTTVILPSSVSINGDTTLFIINSYKKFYNREPNEFEKHYWKDLIRINPSVTTTTVYFAMMTSDEYRFY